MRGKAGLLGASSTKVWDLSSAVYAGNFDISSQATTALGVEIGNNGERAYVVCSDTDSIYQYNLADPYEISTATNAASVLTSSTDTFPCAIHFKPDGTKFFLLGGQNLKVYEYDLATPWEIATSSLVQEKGISAQTTQPRDLFFRQDGLRFFTTHTQNQLVLQYDMTTAWDISTASFVSSGSVPYPDGIAFDDRGIQFFVCSSFYNSIYRYEVPAWTISSLPQPQQLSVNSIVPVSVMQSVRGIAFSRDGKNIFFVDNLTDSLHKFTLN